MTGAKPTDARSADGGGARRRLVLQENICPRIYHDRVRLRNENGETRPMRCRSWRKCGPCAETNRRVLVGEIRRALPGRPRLRFFLTLTLPGEWHDGGGMSLASWKHLSKCWAKFRRRAQRAWGLYDWVWVREPHGDGTAHLHALIDVPMTKEWLWRVWQECGGGWKCDVELADPHRVAGYIAKYIAKLGSGEPEDLPDGARKYQSSRSLKVSIHKPGDGTWFVEALIMPFGWMSIADARSVIAACSVGEDRGPPRSIRTMPGWIRDWDKAFRGTAAN